VEIEVFQMTGSRTARDGDGRRRVTPDRAKGSTIAIALALLLAVAPGRVSAQEGPLPLRDSPGPVEVPGITIRNFGVAAWRVFRGAQPDDAEFLQLARLGVTLVVDLRDDARSREPRLVAAARMHYLNIPIDDTGAPTEADVERFLAAVRTELDGGGSVYVHCAGGRHRTGAMMACFRQASDGWSAEDAYREMLAYDYYASGGHGAHKDFVFAYGARLRSSAEAKPR